MPVGRILIYSIIVCSYSSAALAGSPTPPPAPAPAKVPMVLQPIPQPTIATSGCRNAGGQLVPCTTQPAAAPLPHIAPAASIPASSCRNAGGQAVPCTAAQPTAALPQSTTPSAKGIVNQITAGPRPTGVAAQPQPLYTFSQAPGGGVQVFQSGKLITTSTPQFAAQQYGYQGSPTASQSQTPLAPSAPKPAAAAPAMPVSSSRIAPAPAVQSAAASPSPVAKPTASQTSAPTKVTSKPTIPGSVSGSNSSVKAPTEAVGSAVVLAKDVSSNPGQLGQDIKQTQAATTNALVPYMKPGSTLYNNTNWIDSGAGQTAVKGAQQVLNVAPAVGNAVALSKDVATGQLGNMGQDIKQTQAATTNALTPYTMPGSALYKATDVIDTAGGQLTVRAANGVLSNASKLPSWLNSVSPP